MVGRLALADFLLAAISALGIVDLIRTRTGLGRRYGLVLLALWLLLVGHVVGMFHGGVHAAALATTLANLAPAAFFCLLLPQLLRWPALVSIGQSAFGAAAALTSALVILEGSGPRASGGFENASYAGSFIVVGGTVWLLGRPSWWKVVCAAPLLGAGIVRTGSFGALVFLGTLIGLAVWKSGLGQRRRWQVRACVLIAAAASLALAAQGSLDPTEFELGSGLQAARFEQSRGTRLELWQNAIEAISSVPLGLGPGWQGTLELSSGRVPYLGENHNDLLDVAGDAGVIGALGYLILVVGILRLTRIGGSWAPQAVFMSMLATGLFRQTLNFRHYWLGLALVVAYAAHEHSSSQAGGHPSKEDSNLARPSFPESLAL